MNRPVGGWVEKLLEAGTDILTPRGLRLTRE